MLESTLIKFESIYKLLNILIFDSIFVISLDLTSLKGDF